MPNRAGAAAHWQPQGPAGTVATPTRHSTTNRAR
jgi:hypothetical protein